eukprot:m.34093 g.34093  ORF g.34093 m.34093 type:complete len:408 (-) comp10624_c0_seq1:44-1267(-)
MASHVIMCGDIGGTNSRFRLYRVKATDRLPDKLRGVTPPGELVCEQEYKNDDFDCFEDIARKFLASDRCESVSGHLPLVACFAVAGPVDSNAVAFTNRSGWTICGTELQHRLKIREVCLINDFVANGYGLLTLTPKDVEVLQDAPVRGDAPIACVGAGTGLGECFLTPSADFYEAYASEGGHCEFPPRTDEEFKLLQFLKKRFGENNRVSVERIVSGMGLANVYEFLREDSKKLVNQKVDKEIMATPEHDRGGTVAKHSESDELCSRAVDIMLGAYGCEAGAAGLKWLPYGGLYIAGGIAPKNVDRIKSSGHFLEAFHDKGRVSKVLEGVKLMVVLREDIGQRGAQLMAFKMFQNIMEEEESEAAVPDEPAAALPSAPSASALQYVTTVAAVGAFAAALWSAAKYTR